jgi:nucleotide-binding universal stress UspA family protein
MRRATLATASKTNFPLAGAAEKYSHLVGEMVSTVAVGTDGSDRAEKAVAFAIEMAKRYQARLVAISSYHPVSETRLRKEQEEAPQEIQWSINPMEDVETILSSVESRGHAAGLEVTTVSSQGDPADVLVKQVEEQDADVLVVGNRGMNRRILGSVPNTVTHKARCTVVVVKTD